MCVCVCVNAVDRKVLLQLYVSHTKKRNKIYLTQKALETELLIMLIYKADINQIEDNAKIHLYRITTLCLHLNKANIYYKYPVKLAYILVICNV